MKRNLIATNEWFRNKHLLEQGSWYALAVYMILQKMQQVDGKVVVSIGEIIAYMMAHKKNETMVSSVKGAIQFLAQEDMIEMYEDIHMTIAVTSEYDLKHAKVSQMLYIKIGELPTSNYTMITVEELNAIMSDKELGAKNKAQILCYFMAIVMHIDNKTKVAFPSFDILREMVGIRKENCEKFNLVLKGIGLIVYANAGARKIFGTGYVSNTYARAEHKAELDMEIEKLRQTHRKHNSELEKYERGNMKRKIKQQINVLQRQIEEKGEATMQEQKKLVNLEWQYEQLVGEGVKDGV